MDDALRHLGLLLQGLGPTGMVFLGAVVLALLVAMVLGAALTTPWRLLRWPAAVIVEVVRGTSAIVQLFWVFFALPLFGIHIPPLFAAMAVLGINSGAYGAEVVRGALQAVERGQREAALSLSLSPIATWWRVILPQAFARMLPPFGNLAVELLKNTALVSLVGLTDLLFQGQVLRAATMQDSILVLVLGIYAVLALGVVGVIRLLERRCARWRSTA